MILYIYSIYIYIYIYMYIYHPPLEEYLLLVKEEPWYDSNIICKPIMKWETTTVPTDLSKYRQSSVLLLW